MKLNLQKRINTYYDFQLKLNNLSDSNLDKLLQKSKRFDGWGINHILNFDNKKVFLKRVSLTNKEYNNQFSTKNVFDLPLCYQYGVGSAGFGAYRELLTHIKTSQWVLKGEILNFPLMYHYRVIPKKSNNDKFLKKKTSKYYLQWNKNPQIKEFIKAREDSKYELFIFLEYFPHTLRTWFDKHQGLSSHFSAQMRSISNFLIENNMIHMDAHFGNLLSDGKDLFLTDFGLLIDDSFDLSTKERAFIKLHKNYDFSEFILCYSLTLINAYNKLKSKKVIFDCLKVNESSDNILAILLNNLSNPVIQSQLKLDQNLIQQLMTYKETIIYMNDFFTSLTNDNQKKIKYDLNH
ncbi:MAG: hypothetical protein COB02_10340 [Candidatus Cloacimonadota bacterium]|nr:MAG: hypothetical protein COB02_10340 [Candidatus Cloacimonadota bacterium]